MKNIEQMSFFITLPSPKSWKTRMYGRANFDLLRTRVLCAA